MHHSWETLSALSQEWDYIAQPAITIAIAFWELQVQTLLDTEYPGQIFEENVDH